MTVESYGVCLTGCGEIETKSSHGVIMPMSASVLIARLFLSPYRRFGFGLSAIRDLNRIATVEFDKPRVIAFTSFSSCKLEFGQIRGL